MRQLDATSLADHLIMEFNAADWEAVRQRLHPAVEYVETGTLRATHSADAYIELLRGWKAAIPDVTGTIVRSVASDNTVVQDIRWTGTHTGPLATPGGTIPPTNVRFAVQASLWVVVDGDRISAVAHHLDVLALLQQLGALHSPA